MPILIIILLGGGLLVWLFSSARREAQTTPRPYWSEQIDDLDELGRYKHIAATQYANFAATADSDQQIAAAQLFRALAQSEKVHEISCAEAIRRLGGRYTPPLKVIIFRGATPANLARSLKDEILNYDRYRSGVIERAIVAGNRYVARTMIRIAGGDMRHTEVLEYFIEHPDSSNYAVCPVCGNLFRSVYCAPYCPFCQTPEADFLRFE